ncbi:MAG: dihydroorotate dehydrogenase [Polyangia bacterium]|nr:dihydroorotate dehydrogenase [Polyangia bacterium]
MSVDLSVALHGVRFSTPVLSASGTWGYGIEAEDLLPPGLLGGVVTKGLSLAPRPGNPPPRLCETAAGMLNSIGLENIGVEAFLRDKLPALREAGATVVVNFFGDSLEEYVACAGALDGHAGIAALELNISCPNVSKGGMRYGTEPAMAGALTGACRSVTRLPLWAKLTPNVTDVVSVGRACVEAGADALSLINTLSGIAIDVRTRRPRLGNLFGGLSGPAIKPVALRMVHQVYRAALGVPIVGIGGIVTGEDALEFMLAGADLVQVGTASFAEPTAMLRITREIEVLCEELGVARVTDLKGTLDLSPAP